MMNNLKAYIYDQIDKKYHLLKDQYGNNLPIPVVKYNTQTGYAHFLLKNESRYTLNDVVLTFGDPSALGTLYLALVTDGSMPHQDDYVQATQLSMDLLKPDEIINVFCVIKNDNFNNTINFTTLSLDLTYRQAYFNTSNLITDFEFTDSFGAVSATDSMGQVNGTVTNGVPGQNILNGIGKGHFRNLGDKITFINPSSYTALSFFIKARIDKQNAVIPFVFGSQGNNVIEFGLTQQRKPYCYIDDGINTGYLLSKSVIDDTSKEHVFGLSIDKTSNTLFTIDGVNAPLESFSDGQYASGENVFIQNTQIPQINNFTIGHNIIEQFYGEIDHFTLFKDYQPLLSHKQIAQVF